MTGTTDAAKPPLSGRRTFGTLDLGRGVQPTNPVQRELLGQPAGVDARTAELRQRIAAASRLQLIGSLLLMRR